MDRAAPTSFYAVSIWTLQLLNSRMVGNSRSETAGRSRVTKTQYKKEIIRETKY